MPTYSPLAPLALARAAGAVVSGQDDRGALAAFLGSADAARVHLCSSGTDALTRAIGLADRLTESSGIVALPAYGCYDLATAAIGAGVQVVLYDLDPATLAPDLDSLRGAMACGARVIVVAPLYGLPIDWTAVADVARESGAMIIEDAAQAFGARWRGAAVGAFGEISVLSFGRGKGWTGARGGACLLRGRAATVGGHGATLSVETPRHGANGMRDVLVAAAQHLFGRPTLYWIPISVPWLELGETRYHPPSAAAGLSRASATLLLETRDSASQESIQRRETAQAYRRDLQGAAGVRCVRVLDHAVPGYLRFPIYVPGGMRAFSNGRQALALGIAPAYPTLLSALPVVRERLLGARTLPGAESIQTQLVTLPTHSRVTPEERGEIVELLRALRPSETTPAVPRLRSTIAVSRRTERLDAHGGI